MIKPLKNPMLRRPAVDWILLALCLLSLARGVYQLGDQSLWWDESLSLHRASRPFSFIFSNRMLVLYGTKQTPITPDHHPPLYFALVRLILLAAGDSEFALRYLSLVSGVLIVPLLYQSGRYLYDRTAGVIAALLAACSPLYLWAQQEARPYALATLFAVISFYALFRVLIDRCSGLAAGSSPIRRKRWVALYILSAVAMLVTHYHTMQLLPAHAVMFILTQDRHKGRIWWILLAVGAAAGGVALYGLREVMPKSDISGYVFVPLGTLLLDLLRSFPLGVSGPRLVLYQWVAGVLLLAALSILFIRPKGRSRRHAVYLLLCLAVPLGEIYAISFVRPVYMNIRHVMFASPFYYLLLAAGVAQVRHIRVSRWARAAVGAAVGIVLGILLIGMGLSTYTFFADPLYDKEDHRGWGQYLTEHVRPGDVVFVYPGAVYELYTYYSSPSAPYYGIPMPGESTERTLRQLVPIGKGYDRVWIAHSMTPGWAYADNATLVWLNEHAIRAASARFRGHLNTFPVSAFSLNPPVTSSVPEQARPLAVDFGGQLDLLGFRSITEPVKAGEPLLLSLYWSTAQLLERDYRFTISLKDAKGRSWGSLDYVPYDGTYPLAHWPVDGIVRDDVDIDVPPGTPPGRYWVHVSVYPADLSGPALAARELGSDRLLGLIVPVAEVEVARPDQPLLDSDISVAHRTRQRYGDVKLLGYDYRDGAYQPGDTIKVDTYWRAVRAPGEDLGFSLQLVDDAGDAWATRQVPPADGYPTSRWLKGELVRGKHRFRLPLGVPEGSYTLWLALGDGSSSSGGWPFRSQRVRLATVSVGPADAERVFEVPPMQHEMGTVLDDQIELLGYDLDESTVRPGQVVSCTLYWRGLQEMDVNYTVFTHLNDLGGTTWGQWDNPPQQGRSPTTHWVPGQVVADPYQIPLSQDAGTGPLVLRVGMYDLVTMRRLPVLDGNGTVVGDSITVAELEIVDDTR